MNAKFTWHEQHVDVRYNDFESNLTNRREIRINYFYRTFALGPQNGIDSATCAVGL